MVEGYPVGRALAYHAEFTTLPLWRHPNAERYSL
jgi:hypothetical protein